MKNAVKSEVTVEGVADKNGANFSGKIYIKPSGRTIPFLKGAKSIQEMTGKAGIRTLREKDFTGTVLPGSLQTLKALFLNGQYTFAGTDDDLREFVEKLQLRYEPGHPKEGDIIQHASRINYGDPFFEHSSLKKMQREGHLEFNSTSLIDQFLYLVAQKHPDYGVRDAQGHTDDAAKFVITDKTRENVAKSNRRKMAEEAQDLYRNLSEERKTSIARVLGIVNKDKFEYEDMENRLYFDFVTNNSKREKDMRTPMELFVQLCKMKPGDLHIRSLVARAKSAGILRFSQRDGFSFNGNKIGVTKEGVLEFFKDKDNQVALEQLEQALGYEF